MPHLVRSLLAKGFRSLANVRIDFDNPTFIVGRNGAGKSNIGDAFRFIAEAMVVPLKEVIDRRGGLASVRTKFAHGGSSTNLGLGVVGGAWEDVVLGVHGDAASFRYSFEIGPVGDYDFKVLREQIVVKYKDGRHAWLERRNNEVRSNLENFKAVTFMQSSYLLCRSSSGYNLLKLFTRSLVKMKNYTINPRSIT